MTTVLKGIVAAALLAGSTVAATAPAQADRGGGAVIAGIAGLAIGAAIASDHHRGYYSEPAGYYAPPPAYYGGGYAYAPAYAYAYPDQYGYRGYGRRDGYGWDRGRRYGDDGRRDYRDQRDWNHDWRR